MYFQCDIFLQTPMNKTPRCHHWWEAPTPPVIHQCMSVGCVCEMPVELGVVGCGLRLLIVTLGVLETLPALGLGDISC